MIRYSESTNKFREDSMEDEEGPRDPGADHPHLQGFTEHDFQGHRAHSIYVGVHLPGKRRHRRHHKHHHKQPLMHEDPPQPGTPPGQRVQFILGETGEDPERCSHPLFSEMEELVLGEGDVPEWKETARWIKFEEDVEEGGDRWSKPHVATLSLHSLFELRSLLLNGTVLLDMEANSLEEVADLVLDTFSSVDTQVKDKVREALLRRHRHQHERRKETNMSRLPIIRSLAEIGRNHSCTRMEEVSCARNEAGRFLSIPSATGKIKKENKLSPRNNYGTSFE